MVRHLYASCFVSRRENSESQEITGKELFVQRNPAEILDLTET